MHVLPTAHMTIPFPWVHGLAQNFLAQAERPFSAATDRYKKQNQMTKSTKWTSQTRKDKPTWSSSNAALPLRENNSSVWSCSSWLLSFCISAVAGSRFTTALFWMLRARFAYLSVFIVSSAFISAGLMQAAGQNLQNKVIKSLQARICLGGK